MVCTFFGHRDTPFIKERLTKTILTLIEKGVFDFYVGNNGSFDFLVQGILSEISKKNDKVNFYIVLSYINECVISGEQAFSVFPCELTGVPKHFAISKRNDYLLKNTSIVVCYAKYKASNTYKIVEKARKRGLTVINLAE